jgi:putative hydrolase of the HAD superfamily
VSGCESKPSAILFDAVGTLIYCEPSVAETYHRYGIMHGSNLAVEAIAEKFSAAFKAMAISSQTSRAMERRRWSEIVEAVFDDVSDAGGQLFDDLWNHFAAPKNWRTFDEAPSVINSLIERGYMVGVASNFDERLPSIMKRLCPQIAGERIFHSADVGWAKPDKRFYKTVEELLGVESGSILMIGDHWKNDFAGPLSAGWTAIELRRSPEASSPAGSPGTSIDAISSLTPLLDLCP